MRVVTIALVALLALVHAELWFGKGGVPRMIELSTKLRDQKAINEVARQRNQQMKAEVRDLKEGLEMVEEKARYELGMLKPDEILVQVVAPRPTAGMAPTVPAFASPATAKPAAAGSAAVAATSTAAKAGKTPVGPKAILQR